MSLPFTRDLTFIAGTSQIPAATMNTIQDLLIGLHFFTPIFGDGSDGAYAQSSGVVDLTANKYYTTVTLTGTAHLRPVSHIVHASEYISLRGTSEIGARGTNAADDDTTGGAGGGGAGQTLGSGGIGGAGGIGGVGAAGTAKTNTSMGGSGGAGGTGDGGGFAGGAGGVASLNAQLEARTIVALLSGMLLGYNGSSHGTFPIEGGAGGGGGGSGSGPGYGGGGGGGPLILCAPTIDIGTGCFVRTNGGAGGNNTISPGNGGGGGGGGGGGPIILLCAELIEDGTVQASGGALGSGGSVGVAGSAGTIIRRILIP